MVEMRRSRGSAQTVNQMCSGDSQQSTGLMTLAAMHVEPCVCKCVCAHQEFQPFLQNNQLYAGTVMSGQGSLLHVETWTRNDAEAACILFSERK